MTNHSSVRLTTESGWHSLRGISIDDNARRFRKHIERMGRTPEHQRFMRSIRLRRWIRAMATAAAERTRAAAQQAAGDSNA